jgi:hypothetical protein
VGNYGDVIGRDVGQVRERLPSTAGSNAESGTYKYPSRQMRVGAALGSLGNLSTQIDATAAAIRERAAARAQAALAGLPMVNDPPMLRPPGLAYRGGMAVISSSPSEDRKRILSSLYGLGALAGTDPYTSALVPDIDKVVPMVRGAVQSKLPTLVENLNKALNSFFESSINKTVKKEGTETVTYYYFSKNDLNDLVWMVISKLILVNRLSLTEEFKRLSGLSVNLDGFFNNILPVPLQLPWDFSGEKSALLQWRQEFLKRLYKYMWNADVSMLKLISMEGALKGKRSAQDAIDEFKKTIYRPPIPPKPTSLTPTSARPGDTVTIKGTLLKDAGVEVNGSLVALTKNTDTEVQFAVPEGTVTGAVMVGTATAGVLTVPGTRPKTDEKKDESRDTPGDTTTEAGGDNTMLIIGGIAAVAVLAIAMRR